MRCPVCGEVMAEKEFRGFVVGICAADCGGVGFDWLELVKAAAAEREGAGEDFLAGGPGDTEQNITIDVVEVDSGPARIPVKAARLLDTTAAATGEQTSLAGIATAVDRSLDVSGKVSPDPVLNAQMEFEKLGFGEVMEVVTTDPGSTKDLTVWAATAGALILGSIELEGRYLFYVQRPITSKREALL